ncbi:hypothetical protein [Legionella jordanis]|uniref:Uncharacterized protein n=1 Tax=Legionella jordanis TaxID=456 RepID=A0A0W0VAQ7_9GAMM|nr:hypothetical protein [Legionella jordanis]KTD17214.1 hypothetical protein Ljor_1520 [Legionella jordanis]RMX03333.1 hypothetical protein EAW55_07910 [Legionella jordanis]RMX15812.1 hypothetical protein EAS68_11265 [Legionella jordanis]VEH12588.1 Uncharacterised protein [Legionella jordanis]HAT8713338.1 hypothetical protein [Legionella jordanis]
MHRKQIVDNLLVRTITDAGYNPKDFTWDYTDRSITQPDIFLIEAELLVIKNDSKKSKNYQFSSSWPAQLCKDLTAGYFDN